MTIHVIGFERKKRGFGGCSVCLYNHMLLEQGSKKIVCSEPFSQCDNFREPVSPNNKQKIVYSEGYKKWHDEKEAEVMARRARGEPYKW